MRLRLPPEDERNARNEPFGEWLAQMTEGGGPITLTPSVINRAVDVWRSNGDPKAFRRSLGN